MKGQFVGKVNGSVDLDESGIAPFLILNDRPVSLQAIETFVRQHPNMLAVLEELAKPEANGNVYRLERIGDRVSLVQIGLVAHAGDLLRRQRVRA